MIKSPLVPVVVAACTGADGKRISGCSPAVELNNAIVGAGGGK